MDNTNLKLRSWFLLDQSVLSKVHLNQHFWEHFDGGANFRTASLDPPRHLEEMKKWVSEGARKSRRGEYVPSSHTRMCCFWLEDRQCCQVVRSGIRAEGNGRESLAGKSGGRRRSEGERGLWLGDIQVSIWWGGSENPQLLPKCEKIFLSFFPSFPFLMRACVRREEEGIVMGIWCQTSKPFYSLRKPQGQNTKLGPPGILDRRVGSQLKFCPEWKAACSVKINFLAFLSGFAVQIRYLKKLKSRCIYLTRKDT